MDEVIAYNKCFDDRLQEYQSIFAELETVPYSRLKPEWAYYLELTLDKCGWQAIWKVPRIKCEELKISFPTIVLVYVVDVIFTDLNALVKILAVEDDIHLPAKHFVPLFQLWPTKKQDQSVALNMPLTSIALDNFRFFYIYLVMPWDEDEDSRDWLRDHLVSRLRLYYDLRNGNIPKAISEHINGLINEAKRLSNKRAQLAMRVDIDSDVEGSETEDIPIEGLIESNMRMIQIQNEMNLLENEMFRKIIVNREKSSDAEYYADTDKKHIWVISKEDTAPNYFQLLKSIEQLYPNQAISFAPNLMSKLANANKGDTILLGSDEHIIKDQGVLINNVTIKGINDQLQAKIISKAEDVMFDCIGDTTVIEGLTIDCKNTQCAIVVRTGHVIFRKCKLIGDNSYSTHHGIIALYGTKLSLISCEVTGFSTAIIGNIGASIVIENSDIQAAHRGILVYDNCLVEIRSSSISNCLEFGIVVAPEQNVDCGGKNEGSFELLRCMPYIKTEFLSGSNNAKADIWIKKGKITAIEDLFKNPDEDPTIVRDSDSDEKMDLERTDAE